MMSTSEPYLNLSLMFALSLLTDFLAFGYTLSSVVKSQTCCLSVIEQVTRFLEGLGVWPRLRLLSLDLVCVSLPLHLYKGALLVVGSC